MLENDEGVAVENVQQIRALDRLNRRDVGAARVPVEVADNAGLFGQSDRALCDMRARVGRDDAELA